LHDPALFSVSLGIGGLKRVSLLRFFSRLPSMSD
jgi:hypothetical protein